MKSEDLIYTAVVAWKRMYCMLITEISDNEFLKDIIIVYQRS